MNNFILIIVLGIVGLVVFCTTDIYSDNVISAQELFYLVSILVGGVLGPYYFYGRMKYEEKCDKRNQLRQRCDSLILYLGKYDALALDIIYLKGIGNETELKRVRDQMLREYSIFQHLLEFDEPKFSDIELNSISNYFSFVDKHEYISRKPFSDLTPNNLMSVREYYFDLLIEVEKILLNKNI